MQMYTNVCVNINIYFPTGAFSFSLLFYRGPATKLTGIKCSGACIFIYAAYHYFNSFDLSLHKNCAVLHLRLSSIYIVPFLLEHPI